MISHSHKLTLLPGTGYPGTATATATSCYRVLLLLLPTTTTTLTNHHSLPHPFAISSVNCVQPHHMVHKHFRPYLEWFLLLLFLPVLPGTPVLQFLQSCHWTALSSTQPSTHTITTTSHQHQTPLLPPRPLLFYSRIILTAAYKFLVNRSRFFELNVGCISSSNFENANWYTCARPCGAWDNTCCLYCRK